MNTKYSNNKKSLEHSSPKILVIDDEKLIRWSLKEIFSQEGYQVDTTDTTEKAINLAKDIPYRLIIADLEIQDENGIEMLKEINKIRPGVINIILSAHQKPQIAQEFGDLEVFAIIEKPFKSEQLLTLAREALDSVPVAGEEAK